MFRSLQRAIASAGLVACALLAAPRAQELDEGQVKAAFLTKFGQFVEWPSDVRSGRSRFDLCLAADQTFTRKVEALTSGDRLQGVPIHVREISSPDRVTGCSMIYLGRLTGPNDRLLARAAQLPILTVGDDPGFLDRGGIIRLRLVGARVRFDIHAGQAKRVGLQLSSQLLRLAQSVHGVR
jgi:hypothetical protein